MIPDPAAAISTRLERDALGVWHAPGASGPVAYPDAGHRLLREVEDFSWWFNHRSRVILSLVRRFPPSGVLWDIGGGNGLVAAHLQKNGYPCALIEAGEEGCRNALARGVRTVVQGRIEDLAFHKTSLEAAGLFDVLEHGQNPDRILGLLSNSLAGEGKGRLYLTVPLHGWLWSAEDEWAGHHRRFAPNRLLLMLRKTGFRVLYHTHYFSLLSPLIFLTRAVPFRLRRISGLGETPRPEKRADQIRKAHSGPPGPAGRFLDRHLAAELRKLEKGRISHGSSLLMVCEKLQEADGKESS